MLIKNEILNLDIINSIVNFIDGHVFFNVITAHNNIKNLDLRLKNYHRIKYALPLRTYIVSMLI
jgi:hypothetical protein